MSKSGTIASIRKEKKAADARNKVVEAAKDFFLQSIQGKIVGKAEALRQIENAKQPNREARKQIETFQRKVVPLDGDTLDLSDVQELRVKIIKRDGALIDPQHKALLRALERDVLHGMSLGDYEKKAALVLSMPQAAPKGAKGV